MIAKGSKVAIHHALSVDGRVVDSSRERGPALPHLCRKRAKDPRYALEALGARPRRARALKTAAARLESDALKRVRRTP